MKSRIDLTVLPFFEFLKNDHPGYRTPLSLHAAWEPLSTLKMRERTVHIFTIFMYIIMQLLLHNNGNGYAKLGRCVCASGGGGGGVELNKVHYCLCENGEWRFFFSFVT